MRTLKTLGLALILAFIGTTGAARAAEATPLAPLDFLLGSWVAAGGGKPGDPSAGGCSFKIDLQGKVIVRTNHAEYPAANGRPATIHDDLMVIYADPSAHIKADYYDNEGHVIRYTVTPKSTDEAIFVSDADPAAPRFRLSYKAGDAGAVNGQFEIAPPGQPDGFKSYLTWTMTRATSGAK